MLYSTNLKDINMDIPKIIENMPLSRKIGQMIMVGYGDFTDITALREMVEQHEIGSFVLFSRMKCFPKRLLEINLDLQRMAADHSDIPLFLAADQEGGFIIRLTEGATIPPSQMSLAATGDPGTAYAGGLVTAREMRAVGLNMNFAPVLDINSDSDNPAIGIRAYGDSPEVVTDYGLESIRAHIKAGVVPVGKHFPGGGAVNLDPHRDLPCVNKDGLSLEENDVVPFKKAISSEIPALMTSHILYPAWDPREDYPATISEPVISGILRERLGFDGLIVSDALEMGAIAGKWSVPEAAVLSIQAGVDLVMVCRKIENKVAVINALKRAVEMGQISEERINRSVYRILKLKEEYARPEISDGSDRLEMMNCPEHQKIVHDIAKRSITLFRNKSDLVPLSKEDTGKLFVLYPEVKRMILAEGNDVVIPKHFRYFANITLPHLEKSFPDLVSNQYNLDPDAEEISRIIAEVNGFDTVIMAAYNAHKLPGQVKLVNELMNTGKSLIVISLMDPYDINRFPELDTLIMTFGHTPATCTVLSGLLTGEYSVSGRCPVELDINN
jgi:beta-N-acetylhexosaminidase